MCFDYIRNIHIFSLHHPSHVSIQYFHLLRLKLARHTCTNCSIGSTAQHSMLRLGLQCLLTTQPAQVLHPYIHNITICYNSTSILNSMYSFIVATDAATPHTSRQSGLTPRVSPVAPVFPDPKPRSGPHLLR